MRDQLSVQKNTDELTRHNAYPKFIQLKTSQKIPSQVLFTCKTLLDNGFKAWLAGGCVRDLIMNRTPRDWDVVTNSPIEKTKILFPRFLEVGVAFGIIKLIPEADGTQIDIAIFRKDGSYSDHRHPDQVEIGDEKTDTARRDFTVNGLYLDPFTLQIIDHVDGYKDIAGKLLKTIGSPKVRFSEDALRLLRAARFNAQLGFKIDRETSAAMKTCKDLISEISRERIRDEVFRLLDTPRVVSGLEAIVQSGLWEGVFGVRRVSLPADLRQFHPTWTPKPIHWVCALAAAGLMGDPQKDSKKIITQLSENLRLSNDEKKLLTMSLHVFVDSSPKPTGTPMDWVELARKDHSLFDILKSFIRRSRGPTPEEKAQAAKLLDQATRWGSKQNSEKSWPTAKDLMDEGEKPGPNLGKKLKKLQWDYFWKHRP